MRRVVLLCVLALLAFGASAQDAFRVRVTRIRDGRTIVVRDYLGSEVTVRLAGIDVPRRYQQYAAQSKESLRKLVRFKTVTVLPVARERGWVLGTVLLDDDDVALEQVRLGFAWSDGTHRDYDFAQAEAQRAGIGMWSAERR